MEVDRSTRPLTIFGCVCRLGHWRDFAWRCSVVAHLMQEVDGFADQQNLGGSRRRNFEHQPPGDSGWS